MAVFDGMDVKRGFWITVGVFAAIFVVGMLMRLVAR